VAKTYSLDIELESPLIITSKQIGKTLYNEFEYIPGSTLRGAILGELKRSGHEISEEIENPSLIVQPAYPLIDGFLAEPSHPFIYECKLCKEILVSDAIIEFYEKGELNVNKLIKESCSKGHRATLKSLGGRLIIYKGNKIEKVSLENVALSSVGISKKIRTSEIGMLYDYIGIAPGYRFRSIITGKEEIINKIREIKKIYLGRGISRGFGRAKIEIKDIDLKNKEKIKKSIISNKLIIKAYSPIFDIKIEESGLYTVLDLNIQKLYKWNIINGSNKAITGLTKVSGFSFYDNSITPKPSFNAIKEGSIFFFETKDVNDELIDYLSQIEVNGIQPFNYIGINHLRVLER